MRSEYFKKMAIRNYRYAMAFKGNAAYLKQAKAALREFNAWQHFE